MDRYLTNWYCCTTEEEALRLAGIDNTPVEKIRLTKDVEPVHIAEGWIFWSDGKFSTGIGNKILTGGSLSEDAVRSIGVLRGSDSGEVEGGLVRMTKLDKILSKKTVSGGASRGLYSSRTVEKLEVRWTDGSQGVLFSFSVGYFEGYVFDIFNSLEALEKYEGLRG